MLVTSLEGVEHAQNLCCVAAGRGGVGQDQADGLLGVDDEDGADGESDALGVNVGLVLLVDPGSWVRRVSGTLRVANLHVVQVRDLTALVADDGELEAAAGDLVDVLDPAAMALDCVGREADELCATLGKLRLELGKGTELGGADGCVVLGVGEEDDPFVANELCSAVSI